MFGPYEKGKIKRCKILTTNKNFLLLPLCTFFYEIILYLSVPISRIKSRYGEEFQYLFCLCRNVYRRFRKRFHRKFQKNFVENIKLMEFFIDAFPVIGMFKAIYRTIFTEYCLTFEFIFYVTFVLLAHILVQKRQNAFLRNKLNNCDDIAGYF